MSIRTASFALITGLAVAAAPIADDRLTIAQPQLRMLARYPGVREDQAIRPIAAYRIGISAELNGDGLLPIQPQPQDLNGVPDHVFWYCLCAV